MNARDSARLQDTAITLIIVHRRQDDGDYKHVVHGHRRRSWSRCKSVKERELIEEKVRDLREVLGGCVLYGAKVGIENWWKELRVKMSVNKRTRGFNKKSRGIRATLF